MSEEGRNKLKVWLSEAALLAVLGLAFQAGFAWAQILLVKDAQANLSEIAATHVTRSEFTRLDNQVGASPERLARLEAQMTQVLATAERIERRLEGRQ